MLTPEKLAILRLFRSENVGPITYKQLMARFGSAQAALAAIPDMAAKGGAKRVIKVCSEKEAMAEIDAHRKKDIHLLFDTDPAYPTYLKSIYDAPPVLSVNGNISILNKPSIAIVGSRNASVVGRRLAATLAKDLGGAGYNVVSGLARGIDTAAHEASLETGTIAVLAGGVDQIYPPENKALYQRMSEIGAIVSESPLGLEPQARLFPKRNRIISGVSLGVIVVEAALQSGSLITAQCALDQNREVFAVPGSPLDPRANGTNSLLKQGAVLVESAEDVISTLSRLEARKIRETSNRFLHGPANVTTTEQEVQAARKELSELLSFTPIELDLIIRHANVPPQALYTALLEMELAGSVERTIGNRVSLISEDFLKIA